jgi:hypothetical protein
MMMKILISRGKRKVAKQLLKHPIKGTRALVKGNRMSKMLKSPTGMVALGALVAVPVGLMALKRVRAH